MHLKSVWPQLSQQLLRGGGVRKAEVSPTDMRPEAPCLMSRLHACTSTLTNNRLSSSVMEVNQTLFWHQVRNGKDNKESVGLRYVSDKAVIFDPLGCFSFYILRNSWWLNHKTWFPLLIQAKCGKCANSESLITWGIQGRLFSTTDSF